ncbi:hypothetical protein [Micromonospora sp. NPDC005203]|uniref:hypothetical protein n=1 Tax=Micromonospora sp. NPDC005203 TaxID=3364226 RepID=UPI0036A94A53
MLPADDADALDWLAFEQAGVLTTAQVSSLLSEGAVRGRIRSGRWRSICRGILLTGNGRLSRDQQLWVAVLAAGPGAVLAGVTAATEAGVRGLRREPLHVQVPAARRAARTSLRRLPIDMPAVLVHRTSVLPDSHRQLAPSTAHHDGQSTRRRGGLGSRSGGGAGGAGSRLSAAAGASRGVADRARRPPASAPPAPDPTNRR